MELKIKDLEREREDLLGDVKALKGIINQIHINR